MSDGTPAEPPVEEPGESVDAARRPERLVPVAVPRRVGVRRVPILAAVGVLLVAGGLADRTGASGQPTRSVGVGSPQAVAAPAAALSSSWFCAGATDNPGGPASGHLVMTNAGNGPVTAQVALVPSRGSRVEQRVAVAAQGQATVAEQVPGGSPWIGAVVDFDGGAATVSQVLSGPAGGSSTPCATSGSSQWYFAAGQTLINASEELTLLNPYPSEAVVDLTFTTDQGVEQPSDFQALTVPAGGLTAVDVGSHLRRRQHIAVSITARTGGRLVAWKTDAVRRPSKSEAVLGAKVDPSSANASDPAAPVGGLTALPGSPAPARRWVWPAGDAGNGTDEQYAIYNPGPVPAQVELAINLDQGTAEPFLVTVGPDQVTTVMAGAEARIPPGVGHSAVLRSTNGVPVVAERTAAVGPPATGYGLGELFGSQIQADVWLLPTAAGTGTSSQVVLFNPSAAAEHVSFARLGGQSLPGVAAVPLPAGARAVVALSRVEPTLVGPVVARADGPMVVESDLTATDNDGLSMSLGIPLASGSS